MKAQTQTNKPEKESEERKSQTREEEVGETQKKICWMAEKEILN